MLTCARCGTESPDGFRFCPSCGAQLEQVPAARQARKVVTALFCDVTGSTALGEQLDPEVLRGVINRYFAELRATIERHGGTVDKFAGDAVMAVFGIPRVHEDDALRAVRAAAEIRERLPAVAAEVGVVLRFRTGVNTGPVLMGEGENLAIGDAVNVAARLEQAAAPGEIVLGPETLRLVRDAVRVEALEPLALKGKSELVAAFRLVAVDPAAPGVARHLDSPLVGRVLELRGLRDAWKRVVRESGCHLFTLLGMAGVGKSRLVAELLAGVADEALVLRGRCLSYGEGITFWPLVEALAALGDRGRTVVDRMGRGGAAVPEELFWEARRLLETLAAERPVVMHIDDLQWAQPMFLDLLDHVVDLSRGAPILVLCTARPELLEDRPGWGGGKLNAQAVLLEALGTNESLELLEQLGDGLDGDARARVVAAGEGNPLFLEEMAALARESGAVTVPATVKALLAARLERLGLEERELLERGAVEGEVFHRRAVCALAPERLAGEVDAGLARLVRRELIRPHPATVQGDEAFRFRHLLIRDAAYDALPMSTRSELHERFAGWLDEAAAGLAELDAIAGWHLEQTVRYRGLLGQPADPDLTRRAAERLYRAGRRAAERDDEPAARSLLARALALAADGQRLHAAISVELAAQLIENPVGAGIEELLSAAEDDPGLAAFAELTRFHLFLRTRPNEATAMIESRLPGIIADFQRAGDDRGLAQAHMAWFNVHWLRGRTSPAAQQAALAAEHARRAGDEGARSRAIVWYLSALILGEQHRDTIRREIESLEVHADSAYLAAGIALARGRLEELEGDTQTAVALVESAIKSFEEMGILALAGACYQNLGQIELLVGDSPAARGALERGDRLLAGLGEQAFRSTVQAMLADVKAALGERDAALAAAELAERLSATEDVFNFVYTHEVRSRLALDDGDVEAAERWARSSLDYAYQTDMYLTRAKARTLLSRVLAVAGRTADAVQSARAALDIYVRKGDRLRAAQAQAHLAGLERAYPTAT